MTRILLRGVAALIVCCSLPARGQQVAVDRPTARALGELATVAASRHKVFDVISSADLRRTVEFEAERQVAGCSEDATSCLADVAGAMGARYVVFGQLAMLGSQIVVPLNLFDSQTGSSVGRVVIRGASLEEILGRIDSAMDELLAPAIAASARGGARVRLLVMDLDPPQPAPATSIKAAAAASASDDATGLWMLTGGGGTALLGALLIGGGAVAGVQAEAADVTAKGEGFQDSAISAYRQRDLMVGIANSLFIGGGIALAAGVGAAAASFFWE